MKGDALLQAIEAMNLARESAVLAHQCWALLIKSRDVLKKSLINSGSTHMKALNE